MLHNLGFEVYGFKKTELNHKPGYIKQMFYDRQKEELLKTQDYIKVAKKELDKNKLELEIYEE